MSDCEKCSPTMYANDHISCQQCEGGQFLQTKGKRSCLSCPIGYFRGSKSNKADECPRCAKGYFSAIEASTGCDECDRGQYWDSKTASSFGRCHDCEAGKYQDSRGRLLCLDCPHGKLVRNWRGGGFTFFFSDIILFSVCFFFCVCRERSPPPRNSIAAKNPILQWHLIACQTTSVRDIWTTRITM
jgi:hypothetical protein